LSYFCSRARGEAQDAPRYLGGAATWEYCLRYQQFSRVWTEILSHRKNVLWGKATASAARTDLADTHVMVNLTVRLQPLQGFGGAVTDSMAYVFSQLGPWNQAEVLDYLWGDQGN